jgi:hypothetical protein
VASGGTGRSRSRQRAINRPHLGDTYSAAGDPEAACAALSTCIHDSLQAAYAMGLERISGVHRRFPQRWA